MPRLRVFAGPNGSGKSTIKSRISPALIKTYVNADDLEKEAKATGFIDLNLTDAKVDYRNVSMNSYFASVITDFIRQRLLDKRQSFTFETVMSHPSKVAFLKEAQALGYRTHLYFVST